MILQSGEMGMGVEMDLGIDPRDGRTSYSLLLTTSKRNSLKGGFKVMVKWGQGGDGAGSALWAENTDP